MHNRFHISSLSYKQKLFLGFALVFMFLLVLTFFLVHTSRKFTETTKEIEHTNKILFTSQLVVSAATDIETGTRGFLVTGEKKYLESFYKGQSEISVRMEDLVNQEKSVFDNPMQISRLDSLSSLLKEWIRISISSLQELPPNTYLNNAELAFLERGRLIMDTVRNKVVLFQNEEKNLLAKSRAENGLNINRTYNLVYIFLFVIISLLITAWVLLVVNFNDREIAHAETLKSEKFYKFTTEINDLILHEPDIEKIYSSVSHIAIKTGDFLFAWIGEKDADSLVIKPIQWAGKEDGYLAAIKIIAADSLPEGLGPSGRAIRDKKYYYCNDIENDPIMAPWRVEALKRDYLSSIALPIFIEGETKCLLTLYANRKNYFKKEEITLLNRVAENLGFAIEAIENKEKQKQTEAQLRKVSLAVEQSSSSIVITDLEGNIEYVNPAFSKLTGYTMEEAIGQNPRILKTGHTKEEEYVDLWEHITHKTSWQGEFQNKKKNGETYWEYAIISPIINEKDEITHYVAVKENITERKKMALALDEKNKLVNRIMELTTDIISVLDIDGKRLFLSKSAEQILGYSIEELLGHHANEVILPDDQYLMNEVLINLKKGITEKELSIRYKAKNGEIKSIDWFLIWDEETQCLYSIGRDKTKEKEEMLIKEKEKTEFENKIMRAVFEGEEKQNKSISLELHDNINQILAASQIYLDMYIANRKEELLHQIQTLLKQSVQEIRNLSHVVATPIVVEKKWVNSIRTMLKPFNDSTDITFEFSSDREEYTISDDLKINIYRIIQEQTKNIVKHSKAQNAFILLNQTNDYLVLQVADDSEGFDMETLSDGIGLTNIRTRVDMFNGTFEIYSKPNEGCKMVMTFNM